MEGKEVSKALTYEKKITDSSLKKESQLLPGAKFLPKIFSNMPRTKGGLLGFSKLAKII